MAIKRGVLYILLALGILLIGTGVGLLFILPATVTTETTIQTVITPSSSSPEVAFFPVQKAGYEVLAYPAALATGTLVLDNGYLRLASGTDPASTGDGLLIIWPPYSTLQVENNIVQILNQKGKPIARLGETLHISGGEVPTEIVTKYTGQTLPEDCPGPYWLAAPGVYNIPLPSPDVSPVNALDEGVEIDPLLFEATDYAKYYGITVDEALNRLKLQDAFSNLNLESQLESNEAETFGGLWIQHQPEYKLVVAFTRDGEATMQKYRASIPDDIATYIEIRTVKTSQNDLLKDQEKIDTALRHLEIPFNSCTYVVDNEVQVSITKAKQSDFEKAVQSGQLEIPETVKVDFVDSLGELD